MQIHCLATLRRIGRADLAQASHRNFSHPVENLASEETEPKVSSGQRIARIPGVFDGKLDKQPGAVPDIRASGDSVIFVIPIPGEGAQLIIRCDPQGGMHASVEVFSRGGTR